MAGIEGGVTNGVFTGHTRMFNSERPSSRLWTNVLRPFKTTTRW